MTSKLKEMWNATISRLTLWLIRRSIACPCESQIPRSGEAGERVNCFVVFLTNNGQRSHVVNGIDGTALLAKRFMQDGLSGAIEKIPVAATHPRSVEFVHFYGLATISFHGVASRVFGMFFPWKHALARLHRVKHRMLTVFHTRRSIALKTRVDVLRHIVEKKSDGREFSEVGLVVSFYSPYAFFRDDCNALQARLRLILDSLVESGELRKINGSYTITGRAIASLEAIEAEDRRHARVIKVQWSTLVLTVFLLVAALLQAGVIRSPVLLDLCEGREVDCKPPARLDGDASNPSQNRPVSSVDRGERQ